MRIKIIAILKKQYSLVVTEPPRTKEGISLFLSRALEILEPGDTNQLMFSVPKTEGLYEHFLFELKNYKISIANEYENIDKYINDITPSTFFELEVPDDVEVHDTNHHIRPLFENEVKEGLHEYKCICRKSYFIGVNGDFESIESLEQNGCSECDYAGKFAYKSDIQLK